MSSPRSTIPNLVRGMWEVKRFKVCRNNCATAKCALAAIQLYLKLGAAIVVMHVNSLSPAKPSPLLHKP